MNRPKENKEREDRITEEIVVDAYNEEERAMGWYYYAADHLEFPFKARCRAKRATSPLRIGETVEVAGMADVDDCGRELLVLIKWQGDSLAVPLCQLEASATTAMTRQVLADWKYWADRRYLF